MTALVLVDSVVNDPAKYAEYMKVVPATVARFGGRFLARGGATVRLEGEWTPNRIVVIEFPSFEQAKAWYQSVEYTGARRLRSGAARLNMIAVDGVPAPQI